LKDRQFIVKYIFEIVIRRKICQVIINGLILKARKGAQDAKRGKMFTKVAKEIIVAARLGGGDPENNPRLRNAMQAAREINMPNDNIKRAIARGTGAEGGASIEEVLFEGFGPSGVAIMVEVQTR